MHTLKRRKIVGKLEQFQAFLRGKAGRYDTKLHPRQTLHSSNLIASDLATLNQLEKLWLLIFRKKNKVILTLDAI